MANNTLGEWSDGDDDWIFEIDESTFLPQTTQPNTLGEWSDGEDDWIFEIDESTFLPQAIQANTLGEFSDGEDDWVYEIDENARDNSKDDDENEVLNQVGHGQKRKNDDDQDEEQGQYYYEIENVRKQYSKKFRMTSTNHTVRFNNVLDNVDLLETQQRTYAIFHHLLEDVTTDMNPNDQVRFVLRSDQLQTPISIPFCSLEELTTEKVLSNIEKVVQSNEEFRLNDTVTIDLVHVEMPQGSGKSNVKRTTYDIREYLKQKKSIISINNKDDFCLARALAVAIARIEKDLQYNQIRNSRNHIQLDKALDLHQAANVPLRPCGLNEVKLFQQYLTNYQIIVVSGDHNNSIIYQ